MHKCNHYLIIFLFAWVFLRFDTLNHLMIVFNSLGHQYQISAKIVTQPGWNSATVWWFLIYDEGV